MDKLNGKFVIILNIQPALSLDDMAVPAAVGFASTAALVVDVVELLRNEHEIN